MGKLFLYDTIYIGSDDATFQSKKYGYTIEDQTKTGEKHHETKINCHSSNCSVSPSHSQCPAEG